jgi:DtxR family Mn-dependent transcriptional regulator
VSVSRFEPAAFALTSLRPGKSGTVVRIGSTEPGRAVRLSSLGLVPGAAVTLVQLRPAVILRVGETSIAVDKDVADEIFVAARD